MILVGVVSKVVRRYLPKGSGVLFTQDARRGFVLALAGSVVIAGLELLGLGTLLLLMQQLTLTGDESALPAAVQSWLGDPSPRTTLVYLGGAVLAVFLAKALFALRFRWWLLNFVAQQEAETAYRLLVGYARGPYWRVLDRDTGSLVRNMYDSTAAVYGMVVGPLVQLTTELLTVLAVLTFLLFAMPIPTVAALVFFGLSTFVINRAVRTRAPVLGQRLADLGKRAYRATLDTRGGIKEIKVRRTQEHFIREFREARTEWAGVRAASTFLTEMPRYVLEVLFIGCVLLVITLVVLTTDAGESLPLIALFVAAGFRLLPSTVRMMGALTAVRTGLPQMELVVRDLLDDLDLADTVRKTERGSDGSPSTRASGDLELRDLHFRYPTGDADVIDGVDATVPFGHSVAFVGSSGAGKSTLVDLVLGLHEPSSGEILIGGRPISADIATWQRSIGFVPQDVFLMDAPLRDNILLGLDGDAADEQRLMDVIGKAQLGDLLEELPEGLDAMLGERGSRVSGGQRQRIGIARALYVQPSVLVLDEATSALDNETERRITSTIESIRGDVTTIVVAHRLSTVRHCDTVIYLENGQVSAQGTFDEVTAQSPAFANLVRLGRL